MPMRPVYVTLIDASGGAKSKLVPMNWRKTPFNITVRTVVVTAPVNYDIQYTADDIRDPAFTEAGANWTSLTGMAAATANAEATLISPVTCMRVLLNSGTGTLKTEIISAGN